MATKRIKIEDIVPLLKMEMKHEMVSYIGPIFEDLKGGMRETKLANQEARLETHKLGIQMDVMRSEIRTALEASHQELRGEIQEAVQPMKKELVGYIGASFEELKEELKVEMREGADGLRHLGILMEDMRTEVKTALEASSSVLQKDQDLNVFRLL
jgi:hypothetical protein